MALENFPQEYIIDMGVHMDILWRILCAFQTHAYGHNYELLEFNMLRSCILYTGMQ